jgi:hypothetical protein
VAELVENATAFSPPDSQVIITSALDEDGTVRIEIMDSGIGMGDAELADANGRVAAGGGMDVPVSRQMGLFVVGRLTSRHGILARLTKRDDGAGLRALVLVPPELVTVDAALAPEPEPGLVEPEVVETNGDAGRLELAGIIARLPALPFASSPASILFAAHRPVEQQPAVAAAPKREFTWLGSGAAKRQAPDGPAPVAPVAVVPQPLPIGPQSQTIGPAGLPKRVPQAQLLASQPRGPVPRAPAVPARDAARARGFLTNFQAGVRRSEHTEGETSP